MHFDWLNILSIQSECFKHVLYNSPIFLSGIEPRFEAPGLEA